MISKPATLLALAAGRYSGRGFDVIGQDVERVISLVRSAHKAAGKKAPNKKDMENTRLAEVYSGFLAKDTDATFNIIRGDTSFAVAFTFKNDETLTIGGTADSE